jgi:NADH dehydrogenase
MILVTGGTGFIGQALIRHLVEAGRTVRILIRPSPRSPNLPRGVPMEVAVASLTDARSLSAALVGVDTIYHLAGAEWRGASANLLAVDIQGTQAIAQAAAEAHVERVFYISHLDADRASAFPLLKAKAIAEEHLRRSGVDYTILRTAIVFGPNDGFTTGLARLLTALPLVFLIPGDGRVQLQPLWIEDLATCLVWALDRPETRNQVIEIGGPEYLTFEQILAAVMETIGARRQLVGIRPPYLRALTIMLEPLFPGLPISQYWIDYLATDRTCALDTIPRTFTLLPSRFSQRLAYLRGPNWRTALLKTLWRRRPKDGRQRTASNRGPQ